MTRPALRIAATCLGAMVPYLAEASDGLLVAPGAEEVVWSKTGRTVLTYYVREPFPASNTLSFIRQSLEAAGWKPATGDLLRKYERSALESGWLDLPIEGTPALMQIWSARWIDPAGNEVTYSLVYGSPLAKHGMRPVYVGVGAWYHTAAEAAEIRANLEATQLSPFKRAAPAPRPTPCPE